MSWFKKSHRATFEAAVEAERTRVRLAREALQAACEHVLKCHNGTYSCDKCGLSEDVGMW